MLDCWLNLIILKEELIRQSPIKKNMKALILLEIIKSLMILIESEYSKYS